MEKLKRIGWRTCGALCVGLVTAQAGIVAYEKVTTEIREGYQYFLDWAVERELRSRSIHIDTPSELERLSDRDLRKAALAVWRVAEKYQGQLEDVRGAISWEVVSGDNYTVCGPGNREN